MMMQDKRWYSALNVVAHYYADFEPGLAVKLPKKADEMWATAVMLVGIQEIEKRQYWMQPVSDTEGSPDVRTITSIERDDDRARDYVSQDVEVVTYTRDSSGESLSDFLLRTKLSPEDAYDELTTILVWAKGAVHSPSASEWRTALKDVKQKTPVVLLGRAHPNEPMYSLIQVHPVPKQILQFNLPDTLKAQRYTGVLNLNQGGKNRTERREGEDHCPFESLGVECNQT